MDAVGEVGEGCIVEDLGVQDVGDCLRGVGPCKAVPVHGERSVGRRIIGLVVQGGVEEQRQEAGERPGAAVAVDIDQRRKGVVRLVKVRGIDRDRIVGYAEEARPDVERFRGRGRERHPVIDPPQPLEIPRVGEDVRDQASKALIHPEQLLDSYAVEPQLVAIVDLQRPDRVNDEPVRHPHRRRAIQRLVKRHRSGRDLRETGVYPRYLRRAFRPSFNGRDVLVRAEPGERDVGQLHRVAAGEPVVSAREYLVAAPAVEDAVGRQGVRRDHHDEYLGALVGGEGTTDWGDGNT